MSQHRIFRRLAALWSTGILAAFAVQPVAAQSVRAETVADGLDHPWALAFLPEGRYLVTERPGRMRVVESDGKLGAALAGVPEVVARGQAGLLDVVLDSGFAQNRTLFFCFSEPGEGGNSTALARARLAGDNRRLEEVKVIFRQQPKVASNAHFGCRIVEAKDGNLFMTLGERFSRKEDAQRLDNHHGKVVRVAKDGSVPRDNPFVGRTGALPEIWSYGHRNGQGATLAPDGSLWMHEHGPQGGDEINQPRAGRNYGWPVITYGENYGGGPIGAGITAKEGMEQPLHYWVPSIAPSGMAFLSSDRYGAAWQGSLFVGSLKFGYLDRIELADGKVRREQRLLEGVGRVRDVRQGPDGLLYILTDEANGKLVRVRP
ncbi:PQQ-dependent sugar dehydrogenase [Ramlibacter sp. XY19]|uniref:PQQ-dependent sugar dehydrogenase n=1 Tax=Ramlibacter paludis TaxID=2908000 RepID=UPI0023DCE755|nr:PQQ-dependent sugar dehydrogenase [Ramlibacter paludis]MCG2593714.1 PQQ-dependent sugar dehydrogenase [Ramlibacter paludis]